jgi:hypothetical protein
MGRFRIGFPIVLFVCAVGSAGFAQDGDALHADQSPGGSPKVHAHKSVHPRARLDAPVAQPNSEEAAKAARLAEGRKKFFDRSMGFDNGDGPGPVTLGGSNGLTPGVGLKF